MMRRWILVSAAALLTAAFVAMGQQQVIPGSPLSNISAHELELFRMGRADFLEVETSEDGLGPLFNGTSCAQCHNIPAIGGTGTMVETRAGVRDAEGKFHAPEGGTLMHLFSIPPHDCQVSIYPEANVIGRRISMPLFGAGMVEAIPDQTLLSLEDPDDRDGDGIRGRAAIVEDIATGKPRVGRFGWKAQHATLIAFAADAYINEMGISNDLFRTEGLGNVAPDKAKGINCQPSASPEDARDRRTGLRGIDNFENFLKFLAPPGRGPITAEAVHGERIFNDIGCSACHRPALVTGPSSNPLFDRKPVPLFSDLLLHDIGTGDGIEQASASGAEIRTPALWGLRFRRPFLHDGSAPSIEKVIERHLGEATRVSERFAQLPAHEQQELIAFLRSL